MTISMGFGDFYSDPNVEVNSPGRFAQGPINDALPATWPLAQRLNNALGEISQQQETCGSIIFWVSFEIYPKWLSSVGRFSQIWLSAKYGIRNF